MLSERVCRARDPATRALHLTFTQARQPRGATLARGVRARRKRARCPGLVTFPRIIGNFPGHPERNGPPEHAPVPEPRPGRATPEPWAAGPPARRHAHTWPRRLLASAVLADSTTMHCNTPYAFQTSVCWSLPNIQYQDEYPVRSPLSAAHAVGLTTSHPEPCDEIEVGAVGRGRQSWKFSEPGAGGDASQGCLRRTHTCAPRPPRGA